MDAQASKRRADGLAKLYGRLMATVGASWDAIPCRGRDEWVSNRMAERAIAVAECAGCPAMAACRAYATVADVEFGVWAGQDRTPTLGRPRLPFRMAS